jgi:protein-L-isoaspartate O-methyltransferase
MKLIKKIIWRFLRVLRLDVYLSLKTNSGLEKRGWFRSYYSKKSIDKNNKALPWYTYSFTEFIKDRLTDSLVVFEYGCGFSSLWYSGKVGKVISVEHNEEWFNKINEIKTTNLKVLLQKKDNNYANSINNLNEKIKFDIIVIDAIKRVECVKKSFDKLKDDGVIIFDNSEREEYKEGYEFYKKKGFKRLDFYGMGPINTYEWCTSVFYRSKNCLKI